MLSAARLSGRMKQSPNSSESTRRSVQACPVLVDLWPICYSLDRPDRVKPESSRWQRKSSLAIESAFTKVDCAEFQHSHEIAKLLGSPPGYLGHRETKPVLTQDSIDRFQTETLKLNFLLFDEIEKASDALWQLLLAILDKGVVTLGDNTKVDFSRTVVFMTSNLGSGEMSRLLGGGIGFVSAKGSESESVLSQKMLRVAVDAAKRRFSPEFMNRIDKVIVFRTLTPRDLQLILDLELSEVYNRISSTQGDRNFALQVTADAKEFLLKEGTDPKYGARHLKRAIERYLIFPLSSLISTGQIDPGESVTVTVSTDGDALSFSKDESQPKSDSEGHSSSVNRFLQTLIE